MWEIYISQSSLLKFLPREDWLNNPARPAVETVSEDVNKLQRETALLSSRRFPSSLPLSVFLSYSTESLCSPADMHAPTPSHKDPPTWVEFLCKLFFAYI